MIDFTFHRKIEFNDEVYDEKKYEYCTYCSKINGIKLVIDDYDNKYKVNSDGIEKVMSCLKEYTKLCTNRIGEWFGQYGDFTVSEIQYGCILYDCNIRFGKVFSITMIKNNVDEEWMYTVKFKDCNERIGWPIGVEIWSKEKVDKLIYSGQLISDDDYDISGEWKRKFDNIKEKEYLQRKNFFTTLVNIKGVYEECYEEDYFTGDEIVLGSRFCGTEILNGWFYSLLCGMNNGERLDYIYTNYNLKFVINKNFYPIGIEFWIT